MLKNTYEASWRTLAVSVTTLAVVAITSFGAIADADFARASLKKMSDYLASQDTISFDYDATVEVVTNDDQKLGLASSGTVTLDRPDKIRATRAGGFVNLEMIFDGKTLTLLGKNANLYTQVEESGTIDHLVDTLREKYGRPLPAADLLMSNPYDELMSEVKDVKDLGSGVVGGVECDTFAFRTQQVDWQIWIAQGEHPYPCRYVISTKGVKLSPQYTIQIRNWRAGGTPAKDTFTFNNPTGASKIEPDELRKKVREFPENFMMGEHQ